MHPRIVQQNLGIFLALGLLLASTAYGEEPLRRVVSLDGTWDIA